MTLAPAALPGRRLDFSESWVDPAIGARVRVDLTDHWFATALADVGGFGGDADSTWQAGEPWSTQGGWRHLSIEKEIEGQAVSVDLDGPLLGFSYRL